MEKTFTNNYKTKETLKEVVCDISHFHIYHKINSPEPCFPNLLSAITLHPPIAVSTTPVFPPKLAGTWSI